MRTESEVAAMQCPTCRVPLSMSERQGIEIDCRGVWLDRGEFDKIIERSGPSQEQPSAPPRQQQHQPSAPLHSGGSQNPWDSGGYSHGGYGHGKPYKKRKHWLSELFDD